MGGAITLKDMPKYYYWAWRQEWAQADSLTNALPVFLNPGSQMPVHAPRTPRHIVKGKITFVHKVMTWIWTGPLKQQSKLFLTQPSTTPIICTTKRHICRFIHLYFPTPSCLEIIFLIRSNAPLRSRYKTVVGVVARVGAIPTTHVLVVCTIQVGGWKQRAGIARYWGQIEKRVEEGLSKSLKHMRPQSNGGGVSCKWKPNGGGKLSIRQVYNG